MLNSQQAVLALLLERDIPCAVLKGTSVACHYPHPELRVPGDIDLLVDAEDFEEACDALIADGFVLSCDSEKHICFQKRDARVEMHRMVTVFPESEKGCFTSEYMREALQHTAMKQLGSADFPMLSGMYQLIALLAHMEQHLSTSGLGLRQLCDWAVTAHAQREEIGKMELALLDRCGLLHFAKIVTRLCEMHLGLPPFGWSADAPLALMDTVMRDILDGGNFQSQYQTRPFGAVLTDAYNIQDSAKSSILRNYTQYIRTRVWYEHPRAKSSLWIPFFSVFYPLRWTVWMLQGKRKKVNLSQAIRSAQIRESFLRELRLYR